MEVGLLLVSKAISLNVDGLTGTLWLLICFDMLQAAAEFGVAPDAESTVLSPDVLESSQI